MVRLISCLTHSCRICVKYAVCLLLGDDVGHVISDVTGSGVNVNNNDVVDIDSSVSDIQLTVDNVVTQGVNNNNRDTSCTHSKFCSYFYCSTYINRVLADS